MAEQVWKYPLVLGGPQEIEMPEGAEVFHVAAQDATVCVWAIVEPDAETKQVNTLHVVGTGWDVPPDTTYRGTAHVGSYVWHVFEGMSYHQQRSA